MNELLETRHDFPVLNQMRNTLPPIYFDSACTSLKPQKVIDAINTYYTEYSGCAGRSDHWFAQQTQQQIQATREIVRSYINAQKNDEIIFTQNTTHAINLLAHQFHRSGGIVIVSDKEHNSNFLPWQRLAASQNITLEIVPTKHDTGEIDMDFLVDLYKKYIDTTGRKLLSTHAISNLDGSTQNLKTLSTISHEYGFLLHIDAAQSIPHTRIDVKKCKIDFLSFSGHKTFGPTGVGILYGTWDELQHFEPMIVGGGIPLNVTYDKTTYAYPPQRLEAGVQNYAGIIGLGAAITYLNNIFETYGDNSLIQHARNLNVHLTHSLSSLSDRITIIGPQEVQHRPTILSFTLEGIHHQQVAQLLDSNSNIMTRAGRHCVHAYCNMKNLAGSVRVSFAHYNSESECDVFVETMRDIIEI